MRSKRVLWWIAAAAVVAAVFAALLMTNSGWEGVDAAVVGKYATELGHPPQAPLINLQGDMLLFVFTIAGAAGGFALGYSWRILFAKPSDSVGPGLTKEGEK